MGYERTIRFLIRDGAGQFVVAFDDVFRSNGATIIRTPPYTPVANSYAERWIGTVRRELLDRILVLEPRPTRTAPTRLRRVLQHAWPHRRLGQRAPDNRVVEHRPGQPIRRHPRCGGLINEYRQAA